MYVSCRGKVIQQQKQEHNVSNVATRMSVDINGANNEITGSTACTKWK